MDLARAGRALSARELQVLEEVALGRTNRDIGTELGIAEQTVKNHVSSVLRKLSLNDRTRAVVFALGEGWIRLPPNESDNGAIRQRPSRTPEGASTK